MTATPSLSLPRAARALPFVMIASSAHMSIPGALSQAAFARSANRTVCKLKWMEMLLSKSFGHSLQLLTIYPSFGPVQAMIHIMLISRLPKSSLTNTCYPQCCSSSQAVCHLTPHCSMNGAISRTTTLVTRSTTCQSAFACIGPVISISFTVSCHHRVCKNIRERQKLCASVPTPHVVCRFVTSIHLLVQHIPLWRLYVLQTVHAITL
jgi:hypothetical protein